MTIDNVEIIKINNITDSGGINVIYDIFLGIFIVWYSFVIIRRIN